MGYLVVDVVHRIVPVDALVTVTLLAHVLDVDHHVVEVVLVAVPVALALVPVHVLVDVHHAKGVLVLVLVAVLAASQYSFRYISFHYI